MSELQTGQQEIFDYVKNNLGEGMIDVELDPKHYQTALERAVNKFRQRSSNAVEESYAFLELKENQEEDSQDWEEDIDDEDIDEEDIDEEEEN